MYNLCTCIATHPSSSIFDAFLLGEEERGEERGKEGCKFVFGFLDGFVRGGL